MEELSPSARRVQEALEGFGLPYRVMELPQSTRSAAEAAQAVGCSLGQIAKSIVFRAKESDRPVLVIASGSNRIDEERVAAIIGEPLEKAAPSFVRERTGFAIGGVPPVGHLERLPTFIDEDLLQHSEIWAAAGTPHAVFKIAPADLVRVTGGRVIAVS
ncbi:MAG: YbaK/EbsC family protein [Candidatus Bipolaricaulia bacterium]